MLKVPTLPQKGEGKPYASASKGVRAPRAEGQPTTSRANVLHMTIGDEAKAAKTPVQRCCHG